MAPARRKYGAPQARIEELLSSFGRNIRNDLSWLDSSGQASVSLLILRVDFRDELLLRTDTPTAEALRGPGHGEGRGKTDAT
jgi:hypothetical protein